MTVRDCLKTSVPNDISPKLNSEEEEHLVREVIKILRLLSTKGVGLKNTAGVYAEAIDLEYLQYATEKSYGIKKTPEQHRCCLVCNGTNIRPSQRCR